MNSSATLRSHGGCAKTAQKRPYVGESDHGDGDDVNDHSHGDDDHHDHARESAHPDAHDPPHPQYAPIPVKQSTIPVSTHVALLELVGSTHHVPLLLSHGIDHLLSLSLLVDLLLRLAYTEVRIGFSIENTSPIAVERSRTRITCHTRTMRRLAESA